MDTFSGLVSLRRLLLAHNLLQTLEAGAFLPLARLERADLADNPLVCDCHLAWLLDYADLAGARARCGEPAALQHLQLRRLTAEQMTCSAPPTPAVPRPSLALQPAAPQAVFSGDSLAVRCRVAGREAGQQLQVRWFHTTNPVLDGEEGVGVALLPGSTNLVSELTINSLTPSHSGRLSAILKNKQNNLRQLDLLRSVGHRSDCELQPGSERDQQRGRALPRHHHQHQQGGVQVGRHPGGDDGPAGLRGGARPAGVPLPADRPVGGDEPLPVPPHQVGQQDGSVVHIKIGLQ